MSLLKLCPSPRKAAPPKPACFQFGLAGPRAEGRARILFDLHPLWRDAQVEFRAACALRPDDWQVLHQVCWASIQLGDVPAARDACGLAVNQANTPGNKASALYQLGRLAEVEGSRSEAIRAYPFSNTLFTASFGREPRAWCVNCHAPLPEQRRPALGRGAGKEDPLLAEGVNCAACHGRGGEVLTAREPAPAALSAHPMRREPKLATSEFCGGCHQFNVPVRGAHPLKYSDTPMQETLSEWAASSSAARGVTCQGCHMPEGRHTFPGVHSPGWVAGALSVSFSREEGRLVAEVRARDVGHRVPSGDPFRRLRLRLCREPGCETPLATRWLMRRFSLREHGWVLVADTTVPVETASTQPVRRVEFPLTAPLPEVLHWRLDYLLAEPGLEEHVTPEALCLPLHEGTVSLR